MQSIPLEDSVKSARGVKKGEVNNLLWDSFARGKKKQGFQGNLNPISWMTDMKKKEGKKKYITLVDS